MRSHTIAICSAVAVCAAMCACSGNSTETKAQTDSVGVIDTNIVQNIPEYRLEDTLTVQGSLYTYSISFQNDKSAEVIRNTEGIRYYDNDVTLTIYRGNSDEVFFTHTFTKDSFRRYLPENQYKQFTLAGVNFNHMEQGHHDRFHFIAAVGDPDETLGITYSIAIDISRDKTISMHKIDNIDTAPISEGMCVDPGEDDA